MGSRVFKSVLEETDDGRASMCVFVFVLGGIP